LTERPGLPPRNVAMPIDSVPAFLAALREHSLLPPGQAELLPSGFTDVRTLARELIQRGWLTPYQVNQVLKGQAADLVLGQYVLVERIGEGGMGTVFKARHRLMNRVVALKVIRPDALDRTGALERFHQEIQSAARLAHTNIVVAHDANEVGG